MFKKSFGSNFISFLTRYRLHKAYEDIISSTNSIQDIAVKHGFPNVKSFISQFKGKYGDTPLQYRKISYQKMTIIESNMNNNKIRSMLHFVHGTYFYLVNGNVYGYIIFRKMKALKKRWGIVNV